jgi:hypothetical protein
VTRPSGRESYRKAFAVPLTAGDAKKPVSDDIFRVLKFPKLRKYRSFPDGSANAANRTLCCCS